MLRDDIKQPDGIEIITYSQSSEKRAQSKIIAEQIAEFEKRKKITVCQTGASSEFKASITDKNRQNAIENSRGAPKPRRDPNKAGCGDFLIDKYTPKTATSKCGVMNLTPNKAGTLYTVIVAHVSLGSYPLEKAIAVRDNFRSANGMPPARDRVLSTI